ncbi:MAG: hypothetical protein JSW70_05855 [Syntrophobacterales bacterium]|nr:MAG: hypothetical protein JSW70_05855 [Syntrophobacterales bacterium]
MRAKKIGAVERRLFTRLHVPLEVHFKIVDLWSKEQSSMLIAGRTWDVSYDGLCIETDAEVQEGVMTFSESNGGKRVKVLPFLVMKERQLEVEIDLLSRKGKVIALGKVIWSELKATNKMYRVKIGVFLEEMAPGEREKWNHFIQHVK